MDHELQWIILGALLIGRQNAVLRGWHRHGGGLIGRIQMQDIKTGLSRFNPLRRRTIVGECRPHALHLRREAEGKGHGTNGLDLVESQGAGTVGRLLRRKEDFAHGEIGVGKSDGGVAGLDVDGGRLLIHVDGHGDSLSSPR